MSFLSRVPMAFFLTRAAVWASINAVSVLTWMAISDAGTRADLDALEREKPTRGGFCGARQFVQYAFMWASWVSVAVLTVHIAQTENSSLGPDDSTVTTYMVAFSGPLLIALSDTLLRSVSNRVGVARARVLPLLWTLIVINVIGWGLFVWSVARVGDWVAFVLAPVGGVIVLGLVTYSRLAEIQGALDASRVCTLVEGYVPVWQSPDAFKPPDLRLSPRHVSHPDREETIIDLTASKQFVLFDSEDDTGDAIIDDLLSDNDDQDDHDDHTVQDSEIVIDRGVDQWKTARRKILFLRRGKWFWVRWWFILIGWVCLVLAHARVCVL
jgi:hypothetical protein